MFCIEKTRAICPMRAGVYIEWKCNAACFSIVLAKVYIGKHLEKT